MRYFRIILLMAALLLAGCSLNMTKASFTDPAGEKWEIEANAGSKISFKKGAAGEISITWDDKKDQMTWRELLMLMLTKPDVNITN